MVLGMRDCRKWLWRVVKGTISTYISALIPTLPGDIRIIGKSTSTSSRCFLNTATSAC